MDGAFFAMKPLFLVSASALALAGLAACSSDQPPPARAALDCPQVEGDLTRTAVSADRRSCTYRTAQGGEVTLQLVATGGDPNGALKTIETGLMAPIAAEEAKAGAAAAAKAGDTAEKASDAAARASDTAAAAGDTAQQAARAAQEAAQDASSAARDAAADAAADATETVTVHVPGVHVEASEGGPKGDRARINMPGIHIVADDENDSADIRIGGMHIQAHDDQATIRIYRDVRLKGESLSRQKRGLRATFIYTGKNLPQGYRMVGYEAAGPKAGPLTVAVVKANAEDNGHDNDLYKDVKRLVRRNAGA